MASIKITDLDAYSDPKSTDVLPAVDVTNDETKKVSIADLMENAGSGTESAPGIAFDGDPNTGIYRPGADQLAISTNGTQRLLVSATGAVTIPGDLTVQGTTTTIDSTNLVVEDKNIEMGSVTTPTDTTADGGGITLKGATDKTLNWVNSTDSWTSSENVDLASGKTYKINGTDVLSGSSLGSGVTGSSLTSVGTITSGTWNGTPIATASIADDAVTADKLANTAVTAGSYTAADITVDAQGRITAAANGTLGTAEIADLAVTTAKIADDAVNADKLANTAVTAGSYTAANITVDAQGRITSAANGSASVSFPLDGGDNDKIRLGASQDLEIYHDATDSIISNQTGHFYIETRSDDRDIILRTDDGSGGLDTYIRCDGSNGQVDLYYYGASKLNTTSTGINVTGSVECDGGNVDGTLTVNKLIVDDDGQGGAVCSIRGDDDSPWAFVVGNDTYSSNENDGLRVYQGNGGDITMDIKGNAAYENFNIRSHNGTTPQDCLKVTSDREVTLHHQGAQKLITTSTGIDVTGSVEADGGNITGTLTTNRLVVDDDGSAQPTAVLKADDNGPWALCIKNDTYDTDENHGLKFYQNNTGECDIQLHGGSSYRSLTFRQYNGSTQRNTLNLNADSSVQLYYDGNEKLKTVSSGIDVTGTVTCDGLTGYAASGDFVANFQSNTANAILEIGGATGGVIDLKSPFSDNYDIRIAGAGTGGVIYTNGGDVQFNADVVPNANNSFDLGTSSLRWRNVYTNDLNLSNEGGANDVDGTWGNYTIQEGEEDLFLINRRNGKKYKFNLTEVN